MKLYELTEEVTSLVEALESEEGAEGDALGRLDQLIDAIGVKTEGICSLIKNWEAEAKAFKEEKDRLAAREKALTNKVKSLKDYLAYEMHSMEQNKISAGLFRLTLCSSTSVEVKDETKIPAEYLEPQPPKVMKAEIAKKLKAGEEVPGCSLAKTEYIRLS